MLRAIEGIYRNGKVELTEVPLAVQGQSSKSRDSAAFFAARSAIGFADRLGGDDRQARHIRRTQDGPCYWDPTDGQRWSALHQTLNL
jgi:hypothetical protein